MKLLTSRFKGMLIGCDACAFFKFLVDFFHSGRLLLLIWFITQCMDDIRLSADRLFFK